jgi:hypothetical protein
MEYALLIQKLGSLHSLLRELESARLYQGEHTITYASADGVERTLHIYIDGTEFQMSASDPTDDFRLSSGVSPD